MPFPLLLAAAAAGITMSIAGSVKSAAVEKKALNANLAQIDLRAKQEMLAFEQQNVQSLRNLEQILAMQRVLSASRGAMPGVGSSLAIEQKSLRAFNEDFATRELNKSFLLGQRDTERKAIGLAKKGVTAKLIGDIGKTLYANVGTLSYGK